MQATHMYDYCVRLYSGCNSYTKREDLIGFSLKKLFEMKSIKTTIIIIGLLQKRRCYINVSFPFV